jgi:hypothetical protein
MAWKDWNHEVAYYSKAYETLSREFNEFKQQLLKSTEYRLKFTSNKDHIIETELFGHPIEIIFIMIRPKEDEIVKGRVESIWKPGPDEKNSIYAFYFDELGNVKDDLEGSTRSWNMKHDSFLNIFLTFLIKHFMDKYMVV